MTATFIGEDTNDLKNGSAYGITVQKMSGRIYKPGKDVNGWLDKVGEPDNRWMVFGNGVPYSVYPNANAVIKDWRPSNWNDVQAVALRRYVNSPIPA